MLQVAIVEKRLVQGRNQEWNISRAELQARKHAICTAFACNWTTLARVWMLVMHMHMSYPHPISCTPTPKHAVPLADCHPRCMQIQHPC